MSTTVERDEIARTLETWALDIIKRSAYVFTDVRVWGAEPLAIWFVAKRAGCDRDRAWTVLLRAGKDRTIVKRLVEGWPLLDEGVFTTEEVG